MKVRVLYSHWFTKIFGMQGICLYPFICLKIARPKHDGSFDMYLSRILLKHELVHVEQIRRELSPITFYVKYALSTLRRVYLGPRKAYLANRFEVEAYGRQYERPTPSEIMEINESWFDSPPEENNT